MRRPSLHSDRLLLRPLDKSDASTIQTICSKREVTNTLSRVPHPYPKGSAEEWLDREAKGLAGINMGITHDEDLIGLVSIKPSSERPIGDLTDPFGVKAICKKLFPVFWIGIYQLSRPNAFVLRCSKTIPALLVFCKSSAFAKLAETRATALRAAPIRPRSIWS